jgi:site-specific DNA recombinase
LKVGGVKIRGEKRSLYKCVGCGRVHRSATRIDEMVEDVMRQRLARKDAARLLTPRVDVAPLLAEVSALRARLAGAERDYADGLLDGRQLRDVTERIEGQLREVQSRITDAEGVAPVLPDLSAGWDALSLDRKRMVVRALLDVQVFPRSAEPEDCGPYGVVMRWR